MKEKPPRHPRAIPRLSRPPPSHPVSRRDVPAPSSASRRPQRLRSSSSRWHGARAAGTERRLQTKHTKRRGRSASLPPASNPERGIAACKGTRAPAAAGRAEVAASQTRPRRGESGKGCSRPPPLSTWTGGPAAAPRLGRRRQSESYLLYCSAFRWPRRLPPRSTPADGEAAPAALVGTPRPWRTAGGHLRPRRSGTVRGEPNESQTAAGAEAPPAAGTAPPPTAFGPAAVCGSASGKQRGGMGGWLRVYASVRPVLRVLREGGRGTDRR